MSDTPPQIDPITGGIITQPTPPQPGAFNQGAVDTGLPPQVDNPDVIVVPDPQANGNQPQGRVFTEEDMARARQEEKDKLYGRLESQEQRLARIEAERQAELDAAAEAQRQADEAARIAREEEMSAKELLQQQRAEFDARFNQIEQERAAERAAAQKEQEFLQLQNYITQVRSAVAENVVPEMLDFIGGNTKEEVDASVVRVQERSASILNNVSQAMPQGFAPQGPARGASITAPPVGPADAQASNKVFTAEDIAQMDMTTYQQHRAQLLQSAGRRVQEKGLYG